MKIDQQVEDVPITIGETNVKQAKISAGKLQKLQYILTKGLYSDPVTAVIAEITNNGIDGVVQAGKNPIENPVIVEIGTNKETGAHFFRVTDKGVGLDKDAFENILMNYLESTKENDEDSIGYFGLGSKSFLSLDRGANFICRKNGKEYNYYAYQGAEFCEYDLIHEIDTDEPDGVIFEMTIKDFWEKGQFITKAKQKLAYYDTVALIIDNELVESSIYRYDDFQWSSLDSSNNMHICLKDVYYPLDFTKLGIDVIYTPVALRFGLKDGLIVTPSRENIIYTENVKKIIKDKIAKVADYLVEQYNKTVTEFKDYWDAYPYINTDSVNVYLNDRTFKINSLTKYSQYKVNSLTVTGIDIKSPSFYKSNPDIFSSLIEGVAKYGKGWNDKYTTKNVYINFQRAYTDKPNIILVDNTPKGNIKEYLKTKYGRDTYFVTPNTNKSVYWLKHALRLDKHPFPVWRAAITEFYSIAKLLGEKLTIDERDVLESQNFLDFVENKKKNRKKWAGTSNYQGLNKQAGDITLQYGRKYYWRTRVVSFKKEVSPIADLHKNKFLTIYFRDDEKDLAAKYWKFFKDTKSNIRVAILGKREITKLPKVHNFKTLQEFMSMDCKPFMRIASAILFSKIIEEFDNISEGNMEIFENCLTSYAKDYEILKKYTDDNYESANEEIEKAILDAAEANNLFDKTIWDVYLRVKDATSKFGFITCFRASDDFDDDEEVKKYKRTINQLLLFHKLHGNILDGYEIVKSPQPELKEEKEEIQNDDEEEAEPDEDFSELEPVLVEEVDNLPF